ncbi:hypothetical protein [Pararhodobacter oceanensis]|uniref:transmembrane-type terpene cyclase n=1 Tax=Pararhodobacter oceanensis TaxID=2172121 RepID=UPI003A923BBB
MDTPTIISSHIATYGWTLTYIAIAYRGFQDKSYGMPIVALSLNLPWEIIFAYVITPHGSADSLLVPYGALKAQGAFTLWATLDLLILYTYFKYGYKYFETQYNISKAQWIIFSLAMLTFGTAIVYNGGMFFMQFEEYFNHDQIEGAKVIAFAQNALMSIAFIAMFYARGGSVEGQSFTIAWAKWIGTSMSGGIAYIIARPDEWYFVGTFIIAIFIADLYYMFIIYRALRRKGINPWTRL